MSFAHHASKAQQGLQPVEEFTFVIEAPVFKLFVSLIEPGKGAKKVRREGGFR